MSELPIKATLKAGAGYDAPWLTVDATDPNDLEFKLKALQEGAALQALVDTANALKAVNVVAAGTQAPPAQAAPAAAPSQPAWGGGQQQSAPPAWASGGVKCSCGADSIIKEGTSKAGNPYKIRTCPNQRSKGDGHLSEFLN